MLDIAHNHGQQVIKIMSDATGQLSDRLHFLRLTQCFFSPLSALDFVGHAFFKALVHLLELQLGLTTRLV